jgi:microcystin-dependent protein
MSEPFVAEIMIFAGNFAPRGWAFCNGQLLPIAQNTALFSLIGTTYGGDGRTTTGLPNLQGRAPMHPGTGPGLSTRRLGENGGVKDVTLTLAQIPTHNHKAMGSGAENNQETPDGNSWGANELGDQYRDAENATMEANVLKPVGGQPHNNMQPYLGLNFIIALLGLYPSM